MSSVDVPIVRPTITAAPKDYEIPAAQEIAPLAVRAFIDGTGAGSAFTPALQLISPGGQVMWTAPTSETVAAGASADVSWFPRVGGGGSGSGGINFDVFPQTGDWLEIDATEASGSSPRGYGIELRDRGTGGIELLTSSTEVAIGQEASLAVGLFAGSNAGVFLRNIGSGDFLLRNSSDRGITIEDQHLVDDGQGVTVKSFIGFVEILGPASVGISGGDGAVEGVTIATESLLADAFAVRLLEHSFEVLTGGPTGAPILRVSGPVAGVFTYEIQAGTVWQATL